METKTPAAGKRQGLGAPQSRLENVSASNPNAHRAATGAPLVTHWIVDAVLLVTVLGIRWEVTP